MAAYTRGPLQLHCPMPHCGSHAPTTIKLVGHLVGHLKPRHPENDNGHILLVRAAGMAHTGGAAAAAARQPFVASMPGAELVAPRPGAARAGVPARAHASYTVVRGGEVVARVDAPGHAAAPKPAQHAASQPPQQAQQQGQPTQQQQQQQQPAKAAANPNAHLLCCPFAHCPTAPPAPPPPHAIEHVALTTSARQEAARTHTYGSAAELEAHAFAAHSADLMLAAREFAVLAQRLGSTGQLLCPVRVLPRCAPAQQPRGVSRATANSLAHGINRAAGAGEPHAIAQPTTGDPLLGQGAWAPKPQAPQPAAGGADAHTGDVGLPGLHAELHVHGKALVQHLHAHHAPLALVAAAFAKGLVAEAAARR